MSIHILSRIILFEVFDKVGRSFFVKQKFLLIKIWEYTSILDSIWLSFLQTKTAEKKVYYCFSTHLPSISRESNGTPLRYSCLENPMDGGAWWAAVHGITRSRTRLSDFTFTHWKRKWQPTPVLLPGEFQGQRSLVGCHLWGCIESDTTEVT